MTGTDKKQLEELRSSEAYENASIWTILYDLMDGGASKSELITIMELIEEDKKYNEINL